ncbi:unnamed protein product [Callosobruchus maculatus]|uniref:CAAX prenyl protease n=1 Tax=Callosobruchus maculatus TaxID=64391 RepID=A0A653CXK8_CALMS|nr:unnamed protein product [Callosobruchus maculatus]
MKEMITLDEYSLRNIIMILIWAEYSWEAYLSYRQCRKAISTDKVPDELSTVMSKEEFEKARLYSLAKLAFQSVKDTQSILLSSYVIYFGPLAVAWNYATNINPLSDGEVTISCIWLFLISLASAILDLPFAIYYIFVLEKKFGFNNQTAGFFIWDKIKEFIVSQIIMMIISSIVIIVIKNGGPYFFVWLWAIVCVISLILLTIYPSVIAPLFDKYTPLPEGELRTQIEKLASELKFPLTELYVVEGSKRSKHSNAYIYGFFKKRIVIFDTLLAKDDGTGCKNDEILAILSHELGHWSYNHITKNIIAMQLNLFLVFAVFSVMFKYPPLYQALGFYNIQPVLVGLFVVLTYVLKPYNTLLNFLMTCLSRRFEFQADDFAVKLKKADALERALLQLNKDNMGFPVNDKLFSAWHHSHPPLLERITVIRESSRKLN